MEDAMREIIDEVSKYRVKTDKNLKKIILQIAKKRKLGYIPTHIQIGLHCTAEERELLAGVLGTKPSRTLSGVSPVAVMTSPAECPHGKCIMCPGGVKSEFGDVPQSYTGIEPATRRAIRNNYDPYLQVMNRLEQYVVMNKPFSKVELIVMGGTFLCRTKKYKDDFIMYCFKALNDFDKYFFTNGKMNFDKFKEFFLLPGDIKDKNREKKVLANIRSIKGKSTLDKEHLRNETSSVKCVGLTIETRPDYGMLEQGNELLEIGSTRVELGIQTTYDKVLTLIERGHTIKDSIESIRTLKDLGFKLNFHIMPGLPGLNHAEIVNDVRELFLNPDFKPDMLKIYPCMVMKGTKLFDLYREGKFFPLSTEEAADIILKIKQLVPPYCRIMRIQRDIPSASVEAGVKSTNLRQIVDDAMKKKKIKCKCIRCREIGRNKSVGVPKINVIEYVASCGREFFIEFVDKEHLYGFCRLRFPSRFLRPEITKDSALIRELHVYGQQAEIGKEGDFQHKGLGKQLLEYAEGICKVNGKDKVIVISAVGTREYYKKFGYKKDGPYMSKKI